VNGSTHARLWVTPFVIGVVVGSLGGLAVGAAVAPPVLGQGRRLVGYLMEMGREKRPIRFDLLVQ
jgi:hypothetical protein